MICVTVTHIYTRNSADVGLIWGLKPFFLLHKVADTLWRRFLEVPTCLNVGINVLQDLPNHLRL